MHTCEDCTCGKKSEPRAASLWTASLPPRHYPPLRGDIDVDVAIVGGGITGLTAAYFLKKAGKKVVVLDASHVGSGVTGYTTAHLTIVLDIRFQKLLQQFGVKKTQQVIASQQAAIECIADIIERERIDCHFHRVPGYLFTEKKEEVKELETEKKALDQLGVKAELQDTTPLPFPTAGSLCIENQAEFHPLQYILALAQYVHGDGSAVYEMTRMEKIKKGSPHMLTTRNGYVRAEHVILATHTPTVNMIPVQSKLSSFRSYVLAATVKEGELPAGLFWDLQEPYHYLRSSSVNGTSFVVVGGEDHRQGERIDTEKPYEQLTHYLCKRFTVEEIAYRWSAQLFTSFDGLPLIGKAVGYKNVWLTTGYGGNGITGGTLGALLLCDRILGKENAWATLYRPLRLTFSLSAFSALAKQQAHITKQIVRRYLAKKSAEEAERLKNGEGALVIEKGKQYAAYRDAKGTLVLLSPLCPHAGCVVQWNSGEKTWDCPCHGSRFEATGKLREGPATKDLERINSLPYI